MVCQSKEDTEIGTWSGGHTLLDICVRLWQLELLQPSCDQEGSSFLQCTWNCQARGLLLSRDNSHRLTRPLIWGGDPPLQGPPPQERLPPHSQLSTTLPPRGHISFLMAVLPLNMKMTLRCEWHPGVGKVHADNDMGGPTHLWWKPWSVSTQ